MCRVYDVDQLGIDYQGISEDYNYITCVTIPFSVSNNFNRVVTKDITQAKNLKNRTPIFKIKMWSDGILTTRSNSINKQKAKIKETRIFTWG